MDHFSCIQMEMTNFFLTVFWSCFIFLFLLRLGFILQEVHFHIKICLIGEEFKDVHHSYYVLHGAKNLGKKISKVFSNCLTLNF